ncbi:T9SS type A sorting domain-containing protein [Brumimicrobium oceani]|uniref:Secretion system C-terminal sorting domain-containing protein n=1 Tax=Brumimicrobium oceani TaxID=2100725 RepID=A0A2U2XEF6_9FLAO|nr:T9SS type A sorting domain-containing protein [Brumimicrobium oceani]PWH86120.1 hypothetical protein DIT68_06075 [Brumimicrobium oceani]
MKNYIVSILFTCFVGLNLYSADRYWVSAGAGSWSLTSNWSSTDGGPGGASVPAAGDFVYFTDNGLGNCILNGNVAFDGLNTENYTGTINLNGFSFNPAVSGAANCLFLGGAINDTQGTSKILYNTTGRTEFSNVTIDVVLNFESGEIRFNGGNFNALVSAQQNGSNIATGDGGCVFADNTTIINAGSGDLRLGRINPDVFQKNLSIKNIGSGSFVLALNSAANLVSGDLTVLADIKSSDIILCNSAISSLTVNGVTNITNNAANNNARMQIGRRGDITFNNTLLLNNNASSTANRFLLNRYPESFNVYNGDVVLTNTHLKSEGIFFGLLGGRGELAVGRVLSIGAGGFVAGRLHLGNFDQKGTTAHNLSLSGDSRLIIESCNWRGEFAGRASRITTSSTRYQGRTLLEKTGVGNDDSNGLNFFNEDVELRNTGRSRFGMGSGNPDSFQKNVLVNNRGESDIYIAMSSADNEILGDLIVKSDGFGSGTTKVRVADRDGSSIRIDGDVQLQNIGVSDECRIDFPYSGKITVNGALTINNSPSGKDGTVFISANINSSILVNGNTVVNQNAGGTGAMRTLLARTGSATFNGTTSITNNSAASSNIVNVAFGANANVQFNGNVSLESTQLDSQGIYFGRNGGNTNLADGFTIGVGTGGFIAGQLALDNFTQVGLTPQDITLTGTSILKVNNSNWEGNINFVSPRIFTENTTYRGLSYLEKTGAGVDNSSGGNTFEQNCVIKNTGPGSIRMGYSDYDRWEENLNLLSEGDGGMGIAYGTFGNFIAGDFTVMASSGSGSVQEVVIADQISSTLTVTGNTSIINNSSGVRNDVIIGENGDVNFIGDLEITNSSTSTNRGEIILANAINSEVTVSGNTTVLNSGLGGSRKRVFLGNSGDVRFNGSLNLTLTSDAANAEIFLNHAVGSENRYIQGVTINAPSSLSDGVYFGSDGGTGTIFNGSAISIGAGGFIAENLFMQNLIQMGSTAQVIELYTGTTRLESNNSIWNGNVTFRSPKLISNNSTYHSNTELHKTGPDNDQSIGGNTFNGVAVLRNTGQGDFIPSSTIGNTFNEDVTYEKLGLGAVLPTYSTTSKYAKSIIINSNDVMVFGASGGGKVSMNGAGPQFISVVGATPKPEFAALETFNLVDNITLNTPIEIISLLSLLQGNINTSDVNMLFMSDNSFVTAVSNNAYVNGPVTKIGDDKFVFPVGKANFYRPIALASKPNTTSAQFKAEYFPQNVTSSGTPNSPLDVTIDRISSCEYWMLDRVASTSPASVKLYYGDSSPGSCSGVVDQSTVVVSRWNGASWEDLGNGGIGGSPASGSVQTMSQVTSFSPFTLASTNAINPLPIQLTEFEVEGKTREAYVNWTTESEFNNDYFELEHSMDGYNFEVIGVVEGAGNSSSAIHYNYVDRTPGNGINYYRLKQVDFDGEFTYSDIKSAAFDAWDYVNIYPNPLRNGGKLAISSSHDIHQISIINEMGQLIDQSNFSGDSNLVELKSLKLISGLYFVKVYNTEGVEVKKLVVK